MNLKGISNSITIIIFLQSKKLTFSIYLYMENIRKSAIEFNPHIRGMKSAKSYKKLSLRAKSIYRALHTYSKEDSEKSNRYFDSAQRSRVIGFTPVSISPSPKKRRNTSESKYTYINKTPLKDNKTPLKENKIAKKCEFSPTEEDEIDKIITTRLNNQYYTIKKSIDKKIKKLSVHKIFNQEINTLRSESIAAVESKKM